MKPIYLDYNGSTPIDPRVVEYMLPVDSKSIGNPSSSHFHGRLQSLAIEQAREQIALMVGGQSSNVIFTSSATEANNLALIGISNWIPNIRRKILISAVEHSSIFETVQWIAKMNLARVEVIPVTTGGHVDLDVLNELIDQDTALISVMAANSETGVLNPISQIAELAHSNNVLFHCDATQIVGRLPFDMDMLGCDMVSVSSHKIYGPTGVGALIGTRKCLSKLEPVIRGGGQEQGLRSGSLNTIGIIGFGVAAEIAVNERKIESSKVKELRDYFVSQLVKKIPNSQENGDVNRRLPNTVNIQFDGADAQAVLFNLEPISASMGSACSSGAIEPSRVLLAMGLSRESAYESIRFSLGRFTTQEEINQTIERAIDAVEFVRKMAERKLVIK